MGVDFDRLREERFARLTPEKREWFLKAPGAGLRQMSIKQMRAFLARAKPDGPQIAEGVTIADVDVAGPNGPIPVRIYQPRAKPPLGTHVHVHAGGYIMLGGLDTEAERLSNMAKATETIVVAPDFRLPPEYKFPIGVEDCWASLQWTFSNIGQYGGDPKRIGIGGGCTGGVVSAVMALMARDAGLPLRYLYMAATVTDTREQYRSYYENAEGYTLTKDTANYVTSVYLRDDLDRFDWRASPVLAPTVKGLPPTFIVEGEWDVLHDEAEAWANRLRDAGVDVQFRVHREEGHSFFPATAAKAEKEFHAFVRAHLA